MCILCIIVLVCLQCRRAVKCAYMQNWQCYQDYLDSFKSLTTMATKIYIVYSLSLSRTNEWEQSQLSYFGSFSFFFFSYNLNPRLFTGITLCMDMWRLWRGKCSEEPTLFWGLKQHFGRYFLLMEGIRNYQKGVIMLKRKGKFLCVPRALLFFPVIPCNVYASTNHDDLHTHVVNCDG